MTRCATDMACPPLSARAPCSRSDLEHEWRTPITVIQSAAEVLRDHDDLTAEERIEFLDALLVETARLRMSLEVVLRDCVVHVDRA